MYQPKIKDDAIMCLYRVKRTLRKPMTHILDEVIMKGLYFIDSERVCFICRHEGNDQECRKCYLNKERENL